MKYTIISITKKVGVVLAGVILSLLLLEGGLRLREFLIFSSQEMRNISSLEKKETYRILCLGDSIGGVSGKNSYIYYLEDRLNQYNIREKVIVINKLAPEISLREINKTLESYLEYYRPDMVILMKDPFLERDIRSRKDIRILNWQLPMTLRTYRLVEFIRSNVLYRWRKMWNNIIAASGCVIAAADLDRPRALSPDVQMAGYCDDVSVCVATKQYKRASKILDKYEELAERFPKLNGACVGQGHFYYDVNRYEDSYRVFVHAYHIALALIARSKELIRESFEQGDQVELEKMEQERGFNEQVLADSQMMLYKTLLKVGKKEEANDFLKRIFEARDEADLSKNYYLENYDRETRRCFNEIKVKLDKKNVKFVLIQYPLMSIEPLKRQFDSTEGVIFIDNQKNFRTAIYQESFGEYFYDELGAGALTGHCNEKGKKLLAENVATALLNEVFAKNTNDELR